MNHNRNSKVTNGLPQIGIEEDRRITAQHRISEGRDVGVDNAAQNWICISREL